ncbi:phage integrase family domain protein [Burkholderia pseudomallei]|uniref:Phage integrase family domain protein n=1 Tax=Burkholderia pseudomallei TaxID=28450 RepID=A0AA40JI35_BURPE|nr:phage integrase family domain protein [Burkholderia pseudomallei]
MANRPQQLDLPVPRTDPRTEFTALRAREKSADPHDRAALLRPGRARTARGRALVAHHARRPGVDRAARGLAGARRTATDVPGGGEVSRVTGSATRRVAAKQCGQRSKHENEYEKTDTSTGNVFTTQVLYRRNGQIGREFSVDWRAGSHIRKSCPGCQADPHVFRCAVPGNCRRVGHRGTALPGTRASTANGRSGLHSREFGGSPASRVLPNEIRTDSKTVDQSFPRCNRKGLA